MKKITKFFVLFLLGIISIGALTSCKDEDDDDNNNNNNNNDDPKVEITPDEDHPL